MAIIVHARQNGRIAYRLFDTVDKRYLTEAVDELGIRTELNRLVRTTCLHSMMGAGGTKLRDWIQRALMTGRSHETPDHRHRLTDDWCRNEHAEWKFRRPKSMTGCSEITEQHVCYGLVESLRIDEEQEWIERLTEAAPPSTRALVEHTDIPRKLVTDRWAWLTIRKNGTVIVDDATVSLGYTSLTGLRRILKELRVAWKDDVYIEHPTDDGPSSGIVRVRFCVL